MADYIGARYVIKVYENSLDPSSAEWESGFHYEPLTLVTFNNSSYLSKRDVPASVGSPDANPTYWVITGAYNGQIMALDNRITAIETDLTDVLLIKDTSIKEVHVDADGVKTYGQLLDELHALLDTSSAGTYISLVDVLTPTGRPVFKPFDQVFTGGSLPGFITTAVEFNGVDIIASYVELATSGSRYFSAINGVSTEQTNNVAPVGVHIYAEYRTWSLL